MYFVWLQELAIRWIMERIRQFKKDIYFSKVVWQCWVSEFSDHEL